MAGACTSPKIPLRPQTCGEAVRCSGLHSQMRAQRSGSHLKRVDFVDTLTALPGFPAERWFLFVKSPEGFFVFGGKSRELIALFRERLDLLRPVLKNALHGGEGVLYVERLDRARKGLT